MDIIEHETLSPAAPRRCYKYSPLFDALTASPNWHSIALTDIGGPSPTRKRLAIHLAARNRGLRINTAVRDERLWVRIRPQQPHPLQEPRTPGSAE